LGKQKAEMGWRAEGKWARLEVEGGLFLQKETKVTKRH